MRIFTDPLMTVTQGLLRIAYIAVFSIAIILAIAACVNLLGGDQASRFSTMTPAVRHSGSILILALVPLLAIFGVFLRTLRQIVRTVASATPFVAENADRLTRMGWLALALHVIQIAERSIFGDAYEIEKLTGPGGGFVLALTLFVLARVFRLGTAMREDLEGTV